MIAKEKPKKDQYTRTIRQRSQQIKVSRTNTGVVILYFLTAESCHICTSSPFLSGNNVLILLMWLTYNADSGDKLIPLHPATTSNNKTSLSYSNQLYRNAYNHILQLLGVASYNVAKNGRLLNLPLCFRI